MPCDILYLNLFGSIPGDLLLHEPQNNREKQLICEWLAAAVEVSKDEINER